MDKLKKNANYIIIILLVFSIILATLSIFVKYFVLDKDTYLNLLDKNNMYSKVEDTLYKKMDSLLGNDTSEEIKKSIITDEDVKKEANNIMDCIIDDLKTGESNSPVINTDIYKQRVSEILKSFTEYGTSSTNDLSFNDSFQLENMVSIKPSFQIDNMMIFNSSSKDANTSLKFENLATRAEIEAKGREILKQKGLTEAEARKKLAEKGITEEQAWKILEQNGYLDDEEKSDSTSSNENSSKSESDNTSASENKSVSDNEESNSNSILSESEDNKKDNEEDKLSKEKVLGIVGSIISDNSKTFEEKLDSISNKLLEEAGIAIDNEIEKLNLNKLIGSNKFKTLAKITSIFYKMHVILIILPIILILSLIKVNRRDYKSILKSIGSAFLIGGSILLLMMLGAYMLNIYNAINISSSYIKDMLFIIVRKSLMILSISGAGIFAIGTILLILSKASIWKRIRN